MRIEDATSHNVVCSTSFDTERRFYESILFNAGVNVKNQEFAAAIIVLIEDDDAVRRASRRDLAVVEGVLTVILDSVTAELQRRDQEQGRNL